MQFRISVEYLRRYKRMGMLKTIPLILLGVVLGIWLYDQGETSDSAVSSTVIWGLPIVLFIVLYVYVRISRKRIAWLSAYELHIGDDCLWVKGVGPEEIYTFSDISQVLEQPDGAFLLFDNVAERCLEIPTGIQSRESLQQILSNLGVKDNELASSEHLLHFGRPF